MEETQNPVNRLFGFVVEFAEQMLAKSGEFFPFGASVTEGGEIVAAAGMTDSENPSAPEVYRSVARGLASSAAGGDAAAVALVANVIIPGELEPAAESGIRVHVEAAGFARMVYVPYEFLPGEDRQVRLHEPLAVEVDPEFFA